MPTRAERNATNPDLGVLSARLLFSAQRELFSKLAAQGFDDSQPRQGVVLAYLDPDGLRDRARPAVRPAEAGDRGAGGRTRSAGLHAPQTGSGRPAREAGVPDAAGEGQ
jgi:hypothetical protein